MTLRRVSYAFLCALPFVMIGAATARPIRTAGFHLAVGAVLFLVTVCTAWITGVRVVASAGPGREIALAGALLVLPFALIGLLWVGIGPPFVATAADNRMRFLLILANSIIVAGAFVVLKQVLASTGEWFFSNLGFAASLPAGTGYFVAMSLISAGYVAKVRGEDVSMGLLSDVFDVAEFFGCVLTYLATAAFAASLARSGWLGRGAARVYVGICLFLILLLLSRGITYPDLAAGVPWHQLPGAIAGIPAIPWIMPCLLGVVLLRRAGDGRTAG